MGIVMVSQKGRKRIESNHPWVFASDIISAQKGVEPGDVADVKDGAGHFLGRGYYNPLSQISLRMLTRHDEPIDRDFIHARVKQAVDYRAALGVLGACRLIHAESDFLPALVVDKFRDVLVTQTLSLGMEKLKPLVMEALLAVPGVRAIYERNDVHVRTLEGLEQNKGFLHGSCDTNVVIEENGIKLAVDIVNGQKTGYFLDQRENRAAIAPFVKGGKALHAARYGAAEVTGVDISEEAVGRARVLAGLNGFEKKCKFVAENAFDYLHTLQDEKAVFDAIILDPPAFAKNKDALKNATRGYKDINLRAMKILKPGGFLITCSCSHHMSQPLFLEMLQDAARDAGKTLRVLEVRGQAKDHPSLLAAPETNYLKCVLLQVW